MKALSSYYLIIVLLWITIFIFCVKDIIYTKNKFGIDKQCVLIPIFLFLGVIIRSIYLSYPFGNFPDESIAGYDAWCIANYGVDQHLASYPVYLQSWGSGQSAVYAYLAVPFIKLFGLSIEVVRLPMVIVSSLSLVFFYYVLRKTNQAKSLIFAVLFIFIISPWHIMKSRWALDCNLCPEFVLIGVGFILLAINAKRSQSKSLICYIAAFSFFVLAAYSYGVSWFMLPLFCFLLIIYLLKKKYLSRKLLIPIIVVSIILAIPLMLFAYQLVSGNEEYKLGPITIIQLASGRHESTTFLTADHPFAVLWLYVKKGIKLLLSGSDKLQWNSIPFWGQFYNILGLPFIAYAFYSILKKKKVNLSDAIFLIWIISTLPMLIMVDPSVNHWNLLWFPLLYFMARGIELIVLEKVLYNRFIYTFFFVLFVGFCFKYFTYYNTYEWRGFVRGQEGPIKLANSLDLDSIYYPDHFIQAHILFFHPINPYIYDYTRDKNDSRGLQVGHFADSRFYAFREIGEIKPRIAYVVPNRLLKELDLSGCETTKFDLYTVVWKK